MKLRQKQEVRLKLLFHKSKRTTKLAIIINLLIKKKKGMYDLETLIPLNQKFSALLQLLEVNGTRFATD